MGATGMCYGLRMEIGTNGERQSSAIDNDLTTREEWMLVYVIALFLHCIFLNIVDLCCLMFDA